MVSRVRKFWFIGVGCVVLVALASVQVWNFWPSGRAQIGIDGVSQSFPEWRARAEAGDKVAQYVLGDLYRRGIGVTADASMAFEWMHKAAGQGEPRAELELALMYRAGYGVERNDSGSVGWLELAATQGQGEAAYDLGYIMEKGAQVSTKDPQWAQLTATAAMPQELQVSRERKVLVRNPVEAARWYRMAADRGHIGAMLSLGSMYRDGRGVEKNGSEAMHLFHAAAAGIETSKTDPTRSVAAINLALAYAKGDIVARDDSAAALWAEEALASPTLPPLMEVAAATLLAGLYAEGHGVARDDEKARSLQARADAAREKSQMAQTPNP